MSARGAAGSPSTTDALRTSATATAPTQVPAASERQSAAATVETDAHGELNAQRDAPVGGQAVLEGVMMRGVANWAVAVRKPSAEQLSEGEFSPEQAAEGEIE